MLLSFLVSVFSVASLIIGMRINDRHTVSYSRSQKSVQQIWGGQAEQYSPDFFTTKTEMETLETNSGKMVQKKRTSEIQSGFEAQKIQVEIKSNIRKKGLLKFAGYNYKFQGEYKVRNASRKTDFFYFRFPLPQNVGNLSAVVVKEEGKPFTQDTNLADGMQWSGTLVPGQEKIFQIEYQAQGTELFRYQLSHRQTQIGNFYATIKTNFQDIDVPERSMPPAETAADAGESRYTWKGSQLIASQDISLKFEIPGNFGAVAGKIFNYTPVGLWLFVGLLLLLNISRGDNLHLMHYIMILAGFFTMPLLASYLFDMMHMILALVLALGVSSGIIMYYGVLLKKGKPMLSALGMSSLIFQWIFSLAFFLPEYTGFIVTVSAIISLVILMRITAATDWKGKW